MRSKRGARQKPFVKIERTHGAMCTTSNHADAIATPSDGEARDRYERPRGLLI
jgi:hypothetical protein